MDNVLKGNTDNMSSPLVANDPQPPPGAPSMSKGDKKRAYAALVDMSNVAKNIAKEMKETNRLAQEASKMAKKSQLIALAQHLGKNDILR